jgi:hypothetical protein
MAYRDGNGDMRTTRAEDGTARRNMAAVRTGSIEATHWTQALREVSGDTRAVRAIAARALTRPQSPRDRLIIVRNIAPEDGTAEGAAAYEGAGHILAGTTGPLAESSQRDVDRWVSMVLLREGVAS